MLQALGGRHPAPPVPHEEVRYEVLDRRQSDHWTALWLFTLALADIGSNSGSSKSKRTLSRKEEISLLTAHWLWRCDVLDNIAECLSVSVAHEGREAWEEDVGDDPDTPHVGGPRHVVVTHNLRGDELRGPAHGLRLLARLHPLGCSEVNNFDGGGVGTNTDHVLGLDRTDGVREIIIKR